MTIGIPVILYEQAITASFSTGPFTTIADAPAGSLIVVTMANFGGSATPGLTDSAGNTYTLAVGVTTAAPNNNQVFLYYCSNTPNDLPSGGSFTTATFQTFFAITALAISGANGGLDITQPYIDTSGSNNSLSLSTGTLSQASEIVVGTMYLGPNVGPITEAAPFTSVNPSYNNIDTAYDIVSSTGSIIFNPSWGGGAQVTACLATFEGSGTTPPPTVFNLRMLMGTGT